MIKIVKDFFYKNQSIGEKNITDNLIEFIGGKKIVFRGVSSEESADNYIRLLSDAGEKGTHFRKYEQLPVLEVERKNEVYYDGKLNENDIISHTTTGGNKSKYVSTTTDFNVAKDFSLRKKDKEKNAFIILAFIDKKDINKELKGTSLTSYPSEKEITFYHAIFPDRIIGVFSQDKTGEFAFFHVNPDLYSALQNGVPLKIPTEQNNFTSSSERLGNEIHTIRRDWFVCNE